VLDKISREYDKSVPVRDYAAAMRTVVAMHQTNELNEAELANFAKDKKFEETVASLAMLCGIPVETTDRLMAGDRPDPILILCKAAGYSWDTVKAIVLARPSPKGTSTQSLEDTYTNYERLSASTAQRVVRFWQVSPPGQD
jgi:uncharacterized protein (DUF2336 family)